MTTQNEELSSLYKRLQSIETDNLRMKRFGVIMLAVLMCGIIFVVSTGAWHPAIRQRTVEVQNLILTDSNGKTRCKLEVNGRGDVIQTFIDGNGTERIRLAVDQERVARISLFDEKSSRRVSAVTFPENFKDAPGQAGLAVLGYGNKTSNSDSGGVFFRTTKDGLADQSIFDESGVKCITMGTEGNGQILQRFFDRNGKNRLTMGVTPKNVIGQWFQDASETQRIASIVVPKGTDAEGIGADGYASTLQFDAAGKLRVDTSSYGDGQVSTDYHDGDGHRRISTIVFADGNSMQRQFDSLDQLRFYSGTYSNGESGQAFLGKNGTAKASTMVKSDDTVSNYIEKDAASQAWEAYHNIKDAIELGQGLKNLSDWLSQSR
jgi:hypothetical protein